VEIVARLPGDGDQALSIRMLVLTVITTNPDKDPPFIMKDTKHFSDFHAGDPWTALARPNAYQNTGR
jgi:hypothetical protein